MNTEELLVRLAAEPPKPPLSPGRLMLLALLVTALVCALFLALAGTRADLAQAWAHPLVQAKTLLPAMVALIALPRAMRSARPNYRNAAPALLSIPIAAALALALYAWLSLPASERFVETTPPAVIECLGLILLLSAPTLAFAVHLLRQGASTRPGLTGALTGLGVAASAATGYSLFCTQDNPLFYTIWYGMAMIAAALIGTWAGRKWLRW